MDWLDDVKTFCYYAGAAVAGLVAYDTVVRPVAGYVAEKGAGLLSSEEEPRATVTPTPQAHKAA